MLLQLLAGVVSPDMASVTRNSNPKHRSVCMTAYSDIMDSNLGPYLGIDADKGSGAPVMQNASHDMVSHEHGWSKHLMYSPFSSSTALLFKRVQ